MSRPAVARGSAPPPRARTADLEGALRPFLAPDGGSVQVLRRAPLAYRSTFPIEKLDVRVAGGRRARLVFKDLSRSGDLDPSWLMRAPFLRDPLREITCYRDVLSADDGATPAFVGATVEPGRGRYWLFLERIEGEPLWQVGDLRVWCRAADWLAAVHGRFRGRAEELPACLLRHDGAYWRRWFDRVREAAGGPAAPLSAGRLRWVLERAETAAEGLLGTTTTLLHGDFYPSNILVQLHWTVPRIRPLDWELAGVGPGVLDLAALTSGDWRPDERRALVGAYRDGLPADDRPSLDALQRGLDRARLLLAVRWLGWSPGWNPPPEHAHDWLATALRMARRCDGPRRPEETDP